MKKNIYLLVAGMAAMALATSCSDSELTGNVDSIAKSKTVNITAGSTDGVNSRVAYTEATDGSKIGVAWESTDKIYVYTDDAYTGAVGKTGTVSNADLLSQIGTGFSYSKAGVDAAHQAIFTGTFATAPTTGTNLYAVVNQDYARLVPYTTYTTKTKTFKIQSVYYPGLIAKQAGTLKDAESRNYLVSTNTYKDGNLLMNFSYKLAILKLKVKLPASVGSNVDAEVVLKATSGLKSSLTLKSTDFTAENLANGPLCADLTMNGGAENDVYFCVAPGSISGLSAEVTVGNKVYTSTIGDKTVEAGKFYIKTVDLTTITPTTYLYIQNFGKLMYGGDVANYLQGIWPSKTNSVALVDDTDGTGKTFDTSAPFVFCGTTADGTNDIFLTMSAAYRTQRGLAGWTGSKVYEHPGYIKLGTGSSVGTITSPAFSFIAGTTQDVTVTFDVMNYPSETANTELAFTVNNAGTADVTSYTLTPRTSTSVPGTWIPITIKITGATSATTLTVASVAATVSNNSRFIIDNVRVK